MNGQIKKEAAKRLPVKGKLSKIKQPRIYEFLQGTNGEFSNKRLLAFIYTFAAILFAFTKGDPYIVGLFAAAATGSSVGGVLEKKN